VCAYCSICKLDGWFNEPKLQAKESERPDSPPQLFECTICLDIVHPGCAEKAGYGPGKINEELSNSWECGKCAGSGVGKAANRHGHHEAGSKKRKSNNDSESAPVTSDEGQQPPQPPDEKRARMETGT